MAIESEERATREYMIDAAKLAAWPQVVEALREATRYCECPVQEPGYHRIACEVAREALALAERAERGV